MKKYVVYICLMVCATVLHAADYKAGTHYKELGPIATDTGDKVEVLEFFSYSCPHCYRFEPYVNQWKKTKPDNVVFTRIPAIFRPDWEVQARAYYALTVMDKIDSLHSKIFDAIHKEKNRLNTTEAFADFVEKNGVDRQQFLKEYASFTVDSMVRKVKKKQKEYQIQGVPSVAVNGKYLTSGSMTGTYDNLIGVINHLVTVESGK